MNLWDGAGILKVEGYMVDYYVQIAPPPSLCIACRLGVRW